MVKPTAVLKSVGPKLVPFFKTLAIFFVLYGEESRDDSIVYCLFKCLPIASLMVFVLLHGMSFSEAYSYSRKVLVGLSLSMLGDVLLVWKSQHFITGVLAFAGAQFSYSLAFGLRPVKPWHGLCCGALGTLLYLLVMPGMQGAMIYVGALYCTLITTMLWRAVARVQFFETGNWIWNIDLWTWTQLCSCLGAICFVTSDFLICYDKFIGYLPYQQPLIMGTYYAAQLGITLSVVDSQADSLLRKHQ